jgi:hypothetical protein
MGSCPLLDLTTLRTDCKQAYNGGLDIPSARPRKLLGQRKNMTFYIFYISK